MSTKLRIEEYLPVGYFLKTSFSRDRAESEEDFSEFTPEYEAAFESQLLTVAKLEDLLVLTDEQKAVTKSLYLATAAVNKELNILAFHFKRAGLDTKPITAVKKDLAKANVEGANLKLKGIIQFISSKQELLESKGMKLGYAEQLTVKNKELLEKNILQNKLMDNRGQLSEDNAKVYKALFKYISTIAAAGKIIYAGQGKRDEYVISKIVSRLRTSGGI